MGRLCSLFVILALLLCLTGCNYLLFPADSGFTIDTGDMNAGVYNPGAMMYDEGSLELDVPPLERQLEILEELGLTLSADALDTDAAEFALDYPFLMPLYDAGFGEMDYETGEWTPTSEQVFVMDCEVFFLEQMYPLFFQGLQAISAQELTFTDVAQDDGDCDWENGTGSMAVSFCLNGERYQDTMQFMGDWLDTRILDAVNDALQHEKIEKRFYTLFDGQSMIVFYCDAQWAKAFERATHYSLTTTGA